MLPLLDSSSGVTGVGVVSRVGVDASEKVIALDGSVVAVECGAHIAVGMHRYTFGVPDLPTM